jgi:putative ubiquitin-RnfH superfamily antitoxin RatB of RatAB toxin-antitoxin module
VSDKLRVEVVYARPDRQARYAVELDASGTVASAIAASGVLADFPEIDLAVNRAAIYGRLVARNAPLRDSDRVEILRPLAVDPKAARRRRAARKAR